MAKKARKTNGPRVYGAYRFRDKEPAIDEARTLFEDHFGERVNRGMLAKIEKGGGPSVGCMVGWFFGKTKRTRNETLEASGRAIGYRRKWVKD
jgi:hypothetical protein